MSTSAVLDTDLGLGPDGLDAEPADRRAMVAVLMGAAAVDLVWRAGLRSVGGAVGLALAAAVLPASGRLRNPKAWPVLGLLVAVLPWVAVRASAWIVAPMALTAVGLLLLASTFARHGDPTDWTLREAAQRAGFAAGHLALAPGFVGPALARTRAMRERFRPVVRGALLAAPVLAVVGGLLAWADPVFASLLSPPADASDVFAHLVVLAGGAWLAAGLLRSASGEPVPPPGPMPRWIGATEATVLLAGLAGLGGLFATTQAATALGAADHVLRTAGLTAAEYARSGFFQLLAATAVTLAVLAAVRSWTEMAGRSGRRIVALAQLTVVLNLVMVAVAIRRLHLYEQAFGLTLLRLHAMAAAVFIGAAFLLVGVALASGGRRRWLAPACAGVALAMAVTLAWANPEGLVVRRNVERAQANGRLDLAYLAGLSDDAVPALAQALPELPAEQRAATEALLCRVAARDTGPLWSTSLAERRAVSTARAVCATSRAPAG